jgi:type I restriction enzyme R subunit
LGVFILNIVGLERSEVLQLFSDYLNDTAFNAEQIQFIQLIIDYLCINGVLEPAGLFQPPFTDFNAGSVLGLFEQTTAQAIVQRLCHVSQVAEVA